MIPRALDPGSLAVVAALFEPAALARAETLSFAEAVQSSGGGRRPRRGSRALRSSNATRRSPRRGHRCCRASPAPRARTSARTTSTRSASRSAAGSSARGSGRSRCSTRACTRCRPSPTFRPGGGCARRAPTSPPAAPTPRTAVEHASEEAALRYVDVQRALATVDARRSDLAIAAELDSLAAVQLRAGSAANIDVLRAATQLTVARTELSLARNALERARIELAGALGAARDPLRDRRSARRAGRPRRFPRSAKRRYGWRRAPHRARRRARPDRARTDRARRDHGGADPAPRRGAPITARAACTRMTRSARGQVALQLTWPFFDGTRRGARIHEQDAIIRAAEITRRRSLATGRGRGRGHAARSRHRPRAGSRSLASAWAWRRSSWPRRGSASATASPGTSRSSTRSPRWCGRATPRSRHARRSPSRASVWPAPPAWPRA